MFRRRKNRHQNTQRKLRLEGLEQRLPLVDDLDDALSEATLLGAISATTPRTADAAITPADDVDMYRFTVTSGQVVDFDIDTTLNGPGGLGSYLRVFDPQGQQLIANNDGAAPGENTVAYDAYVRYMFATAGTYYVAVSNANNINYSPITGNGDIATGANATGSYRLSVQALPVDNDDSLTESINLGTITTAGDIVNDTIVTDIDVDVYRFTASAGQVIDFDIDTTLSGPGGLGSYLRLFNASGQQLASNNDAAAPGESAVGFDAYLRFTFATAGTYYIAVSNANNAAYDPLTGNGDVAGGQNSIGDYTLIVQTAPAVPVDTDDELNEAIAVGSISTTPKTLDGSITPDVDVDMYRFTVTTGQVVDFDIDTTQNGAGGLGSFLRLFNSQGQQLASSDDANAPGENVIGFDAYLRFTFTAGGTYYLGVSNNNNRNYDPTTGTGDAAGGTNATGTYQLIIQALPVDPDDTFSEATNFGSITPTPEAVSDSLSTDIDVDMYTFEAFGGQTIDFDIDTTQNGPGGVGTFLRLFNSSGQQIASNDDGVAPGESALGFDAYLRYTFTGGGVFWLSVSNNNNRNFDGSTGNGDTAGGFNTVGAYQLTITGLPVDTDDSLSEATALGTLFTTPTVVSDTIITDVDVDMYRFNVTAGQIVDFDIDTTQNGVGGLGSFLRLFNSSGQQLASNNDAVAPGETVLGFDAYLRFTFTTAGTYYIGVSNNTNNQYDPLTGNGDTAGGLHSAGAYQLLVSLVAANPADPDDTLSEAISLGAVQVNPAIASDNISPDIDVDMYKFTVTAGQTVDFDIDTPQNGAGGLGSLIRLFNASGQQLASNNDAAAPGETLGFDSYLRFTFSTGGTYYLGVSNNNNSQYDPVAGTSDIAGGLNATGSYQLTIQLLPTDPDDALSEANILGTITATPAVASDSISTDVDVDLYRITVTAGQIVDIDIDTAQNGPGGLGSFLRLFNAQGQQLASNDDAVAPDESTLGFDSYLRFTFTIGGNYYIGVSNNNNRNYDPTTGNGDTAGGANSIGAYQLSVQTAPTTPPTDPDDSLAESTSLGTISTTPTTVNNGITPETDVDLFQFTVAAGQVVDFDIDTTQNGIGGLGSLLRLFNAQGQQLAANDNAAAPGEAVVGFDAYLRFTFTAAGTYYIGVSNSNNAQYDPLTGNGDTPGGLNTTGNYQLIVTSVSVTPGDPDDALSEATSVGAAQATPASVSDTISPDTDVDLYRFTVTAGQVVDFDIDTAINGAGGLNSLLILFNASGQQLAINNSGGAPGENVVGFDAYLRYTFSAAGTYYIGVSNAANAAYDPVTGNGDTAGGTNTTGTYQLTVQALPVDLDDTLAEAGSLGAASENGVTVSDSISPDIDVDVFRFTVTAGQTVDFDIDTAQNGSGGVNSYLRLFNTQGQQLAFNGDAAAPGESQGFDAYLEHTFATAGTYYISVSNANNTQYDPVAGTGDTAGGQNSIGAYQLRVQALPAPAVPTLTLSASASSIPEVGGTAVGTVVRTHADVTQALVVTLGSSDTGAATVPASVTIPASQQSATFTITAVHSTTQGTRSVTITAVATGFTTTMQSLLVTDGDLIWHNAAKPKDVNDDTAISPIDALLIFNYLNSFGAGPVPVGSGPPFLDVNADNAITPIDALIVMNAVNNGESEGEGESAPVAAPSEPFGPAQAADLYFAELGAANPQRRQRSR